MKRTVIAVSLAVIFATSHFLLESDAEKTVSVVTPSAAAMPAAVASAAKPSPTGVEIDDSVIWLDTVVVVAPRYVEDSEPSPVSEAGSERPSVVAIAAAGGE